MKYDEIIKSVDNKNYLTLYFLCGEENYYIDKISNHISNKILNDEEKSMLNGDSGKAKKWAIEHQIKVGNFFSAKDFVSVSQAHMMVDPESIGEAGVIFLENLVTLYLEN